MCNSIWHGKSSTSELVLNGLDKCKTPKLIFFICFEYKNKTKQKTKKKQTAKGNLWDFKTKLICLLVIVYYNCCFVLGPQHIKNALENDTSFNQAFLQAATSNDSPNHSMSMICKNYPYSLKRKSNECMDKIKGWDRINEQKIICFENGET